MPKVTGPLFSLRASGTLKGALTFGTQSGLNVVRARITPRDPRTIAQVSQRARVADIADAWHGMTAGDRADWQAAASTNQMNGYAYFVRQYHLQDVTPPNIPSIP